MNTEDILGTAKELDKFKKELKRIRNKLIRFTRNLTNRGDGKLSSKELGTMSEDEQRAYKELRLTFESLVREYRAHLQQIPPVVQINLDSVSTEELKEQLRNE